MIPRVFTVAAVAAQLDCAEHTVYRLLTSGRLDGFKVGSAWRVTETALLVFMGRAAIEPAIAAPAFEPPADPLAFERLIPSTRVFSGPRAS
jgi:excisionase family DNA binding protein